MVRLITTLLLCLFVGITANASQITEQQALQVAAKYADIDIKSHPQRMKAAGKQQKTAAYYAFNIGDNEGFIIVSGDDSLTELVGYSDSGSFDLDKIPDNMRSWLQTYSDYVKSVQSGESRPTRREIADEATVIVQPFVTTRWGQGEPYNRMTPVDNGQNCVTGCVATAMAQVMKYYEWPERGEGSHSYTDSSGHSLSADFSQSVYDWDNMLDLYSIIYDVVPTPEYNDAQADAVAKLMLDCGISTNMNYGIQNSGSSASSVESALEKYFKYNSESLSRDISLSNNFIEKIHTELHEKHPVIFEGFNRSDGHVFLVDGYDSNNFIHINWGWNGYCDGWFDINYPNPENYQSDPFFFGQSIITAYPNYSEEDAIEQNHLSYGGLDGDSEGVYIHTAYFSQGKPQIVSLYNVWDEWFVSYCGEIGVAAFDSTWKRTLIHTEPMQFSDNVRMSFDILCDFSGLSDGEYEILGISKEHNEHHDFDWTEINGHLSVKIKVENGFVTVFPSVYRLSLTEQIENNSNIIIGDLAKFTARIYNNSIFSSGGYIDYMVRRLSDGNSIYESSVRANIYDYSTLPAILTVPIVVNTFKESEEYYIDDLKFRFDNGELLPIESIFGKFIFTVESAGVEGINSSNFRLYPNPAKDYITVDCGERISSVAIFSASGQLVKSIGRTDTESSIHVGDLPAGYYIVAVDTESGATVRKQILKH